MIDENTLLVVPSFQAGGTAKAFVPFLPSTPFYALSFPLMPLLSPFMPYKPSGLIPIKPAIYYAGTHIFAHRNSTYKQYDTYDHQRF